jgi:hypothetical protein
MIVCPALKGWFTQAAAKMGCWSFGNLDAEDVDVDPKMGRKLWIILLDDFGINLG